MSAGFEVDDVEVGPFVEVWATRHADRNSEDE